MSSNHGISLRDIMDVDDLAHAVDNGMVSVRPHPHADAFLLTYTPKAQYSSSWSEATKLSRGLIVAGHPFEEGSTVLARPFPKFANASEHGPSSPFGELPEHLAFEVHEKMDGSLAILYDLGDGPAIATRGSFVSEQAIAATRWLRENHGDLVVPERTTLLFEFVAPWNRIVVDYGETEELTLLAAIDHATGADVSFDAWTGRRAQRFDGFTDLSEIVANVSDSGNENAEGFVVRFMPEDPRTPSVRAKLKYAEYLRLHKLVTGVSTVTVWEHLRDGRGLTDMLERVPDEFYDFVSTTAAGLIQQHHTLVGAARTRADAVRHLDRREAAALITAQHDVSPALVFAALDDKSLDEKAWKQLKPERIQPFSAPADGGGGIKSTPA